MAGDADLDDIPDGLTYAKILKTDISAGHIILSSVVQSSSYRTVTDTEKGIWTGKPDDMDEIPDGTTYVRVLATDIQAGHIKLTSNTAVDGEWYDESGVEIDATHGINIYGVNNALTTRATKTGTVQCYVGSDGKIYAGAGAVSLDSGGLTIKGAMLLFKDSAGTNRGYVEGYASLSEFYIHSVSGTEMRLKAPGAGNTLTLEAINIDALGTIQPSTAGGILFKTTHTSQEGSIKIKGGGSGDIYIYSDGAWRTNT